MHSAVRIGTLVCLCGASCWWAFERGGQTAWFLLFSFIFLLLYAAMASIALNRGIRRLELRLAGQAGEALRCYVGEDVRLPAAFSGEFRLLPGVSFHLEEQWVHQGTGERTVHRVAFGDVRLTGFSRGVYVREALVLCASDALGLLQAQRRSKAGGQLWVLPRPCAPAAAPYGNPGGSRKASPPPAGADVPQVSGTRPYAPGDPLRRIHWRSSARTGELRAKETELPAGGRQLVLLDAAGAGGSAGAALWADPALSAAVEAAAGAAKRALELGLRVRLAVSDGQGSAAEAQGRARLPELLQLLAAVPCGGCRPEAFAALARRELWRAAGAITLVTARADAQLPAALRGLPRGAAQVIYVHGPGGALPESVHGWKRQLEALGCRVTLLAAGTVAAPHQGGDGYAASGV